MDSQDRREAWNFTFAHPLGALLIFSKTAFSFASDQRPENIPDHEEVISGQQRIHTQEDAFRLARSKNSHICREILKTQTASSVIGGFSNERALKANGAPPEIFRGLCEDHFRFVAADADRGPCEARKEDPLGRPA